MLVIRIRHFIAKLKGTLAEYMSVSYTHLDVYKRQELRNVRLSNVMYRGFAQNESVLS